MCVGSRAGKTAQLLSWPMPGALLVLASKTLAAQQAAWGVWQVSSDSVWRPTYQSGPTGRRLQPGMWIAHSAPQMPAGSQRCVLGACLQDCMMCRALGLHAMLGLAGSA